MLEPKIIYVFYGADLLPYKDKERTVHFPIVGNAFTGASNSTEIRFYVDQMGDLDLTWVANTKLPNGRTGSKVLSGNTDENGTYVALELGQWYTQLVGDIYIGLQGYNGSIDYTYDSDTGIYTLHGTPTIQATGVLKVHISYSTPFNGDSDIDDNDLQNFIAYITEISKRTFTIFNGISREDISSFATGHLFYDIATRQFYEKTTTSPYYERFTINEKLYGLEDLHFKTSGTIARTNNGLIIENGSLNIILSNTDTISVNGDYILFNDQLVYPNFVVRNISDIYESETLSNLSASEQLILYTANNAYVLLVDEENSSLSWKFPITKLEGNKAISFELIEKANFTNYVVQYFGKIVANGQNIGFVSSYDILYLKSYIDTNLYTKAQVDSIIESVKANEFQVVEELPQTGEEGIIYLVETATSGVYDKYIYESNTWVFIGTTEIDLSDYYTKSQANAMFVYKDIDNAIGGDNTFNGDNTFKGDTIFYQSGDLTIDSNIVYLHAETLITNYDLYFLNSDVDNTTANIRYYLAATNNIVPYVAIGVPSADYLDFVINYNGSEEVALEIGYHYRDNTLTPEVLIHGDGQYDGEISQNNSLVNKIYVDTQVQQVREVAEGKCSTFILSYQENITDVKDYLSEYAYATAYLWNETYKRWDNIKTQVINGDYDSYSYANSSFNSQVGIYSSGTYLICRAIDGEGNPRTESSFYFIYLDSSTKPSILNVGDNFYVVETNVPDRWYSGGTTPYNFYILETGDDFVRKTTTYSVVYATNNSGEQTTIPYSTSPSEYAIVQYDENENVNVNLTPNSNTSATSKSYVDTQVGNLIALQEQTNPLMLTAGIWNVYSFSANGTVNYTLPASGVHPEFKGTISNTASSSITVQFLTPMLGFLCNDDNISISQDMITITLPANTTIEFSIIDRKMVAINFEA